MVSTYLSNNEISDGQIEKILIRMHEIENVASSFDESKYAFILGGKIADRVLSAISDSCYFSKIHDNTNGVVYYFFNSIIVKASIKHTFEDIKISLERVIQYTQPYKAYMYPEPICTLTIQEYSDETGMSPSTIWRHCKEGKIAGACKMNGRWKIPYSTHNLHLL